MDQYFLPKYSQEQKAFYDKYAKENIRTGRSSMIVPGEIYIYNYSAKGHEEGTLPFYDEHPLVLVIATDHKYVLGLSLHYLPRPVRKFFIKKVLMNNFERLRKNQPALVPYVDIRNAANLWYQEGIVIIRKYIRTRITSYVAKIHWRDWINIVDGEGAHWIDVSAEEVYKQIKEALQKRYTNRNKIIQTQAQRAGERARKIAEQNRTLRNKITKQQVQTRKKVIGR